ncbi:unnamed protein product [Leptidea sinapis]|uniref:Uncharacterized protein n=1 Tax=Leptidea sinapis TaxID=189913 RepID=A0A5E4QEW2_9NEOP|nr:unnamed protein product [Leptidea sinapis]
MKESKQNQTPIADLQELRNHFASHNVIREYIAHSSKVHSVGWSCDGRRLASGSFDKTVVIFNLEHLLSTASGDKSVRIWDARSHKCAAAISTKGENINIAWSPNGSTIAVGNKEDLVSFIDARNYKVHDPTGRFFATGSADALVSLWDVNELACLRVFSRLEWPVRTLSFSFDGRLLASASEKVAEIPVAASTFTVAWHPSRYLVAYACEDKEPPERKRDAGNLKLWGLSNS